MPRQARAIFNVRAIFNIVVSAAVVGAAVVTAPELLIGMAVAMLIAASLEVLVPLKQQRRDPKAYFTDFTHALGNRSLLLPVLALVTTGLVPISHVLVPASVHHSFGELPSALRLIIIFALSDLFNYTGHRCMHEVPVLWRLHAVHHSSEKLDWLATSRGHPLDETVNICIAALPVLALGSPTYAAGLVAFLFLYPFIAHANVRVRVPLVSGLFVTPQFHHWHHADAPEAVNKNYGAILSIWDRLFGTRAQAEGWPLAYGIGKPDLAAADYLGHLASPVSSRFWPPTTVVPVTPQGV